MKKLISVLLVVSLLVLPLCALGDESENTVISTIDTPQNVDELKTLIGLGNTKIAEALVMYSNMAHYEYNYWSALEKLGTWQPDFNSMSEKAYAWVEEEGGWTKDQLMESHDEICLFYKAFASSGISGAEIDNIKEKFEALFDDYYAIHSLVTEPSGSSSAFVTSFNEHIESANALNEKISIILGI